MESSRELSDGPIDPLIPDGPSPRRPTSPSDTGAPERKRRRKVLSCYDCRRRKLQCDRAMPACSRCTKAGNSASCLYLEGASDGAAKVGDSSRPDLDVRRTYAESTFSRPIQAQTTPGNDLLSKLEFQDRRIKQLEAALAQTSSHEQPQQQRAHGSKLPLTPESVNEPNVNMSVNDKESMSLRGKSFKTQFFGSTHPGSMISYVPDLNAFTRETFERFPSLRRVRAEIRLLDHRFGIADAQLEPVQDAGLKALMPPKADADKLVRAYIDTYGCIYHVIHLPSFWKSYEDMWLDMPGAPAHFVALVLLMMACSTCLSAEQPWMYVASSSSQREKSLSWIRHCEDWLGRQSQKHVTSTDFQIRCLLWLAKQTSARKFKRTWTEAGSLLRFCMSAGLHRNPELLPKTTSALDKELRRRIWATAVDFELHASFDRGMVSAPWLLQSDTQGPSNLHDGDFAIEQVPAARPAQEFTPSSYLHLASDSFMLRSTLNAVLNNIRQTLSFEEVKQYTDEIESHLRSLPQWQGSRSEAPQALLSLRLLQYLLILHDRHIRQANTIAERNFSKMIVLETSIRLTDIHKSLVNKGNHALLIFCQDLVRVPLSMANLYAYIDPQRDLTLSKTYELSAPRLIQDALELVNDKVVRLGCEHRQLWITLAVDGLLKALKDPNRRDYYMQEAADKVTRPYYKALAFQEHIGVTQVKETSTTPNQAQTSHDASQFQSNMDLQQSASGSEFLDPNFPDLDELADWTLQDWFNPTDFQSAYAPQNGLGDAFAQ